MKFFTRKYSPEEFPFDNYYCHATTSKTLPGLVDQGFKLFSAMDVVSKGDRSYQVGEITAGGYGHVADRSMPAFVQLVPEVHGISYGLDSLLKVYASRVDRSRADELQAYMQHCLKSKVAPQLNVLLILMNQYPDESINHDELLQIEQKVSDTILLCYLLSLLGRHIYLKAYDEVRRVNFVDEGVGWSVSEVANAIKIVKCDVRSYAQKKELTDDEIDEIRLVFNRLNVEVEKGSGHSGVKGKNKQSKEANEFVFGQFLRDRSARAIFQDIVEDKYIHWTPQHALKLLKVAQIYEKRLGSLQRLCKERGSLNHGQLHSGKSDVTPSYPNVSSFHCRESNSISHGW